MSTLSPAVVVAFVIASLYGWVFFLLFGKGWLRLGLYWLVGVIGFAVGQWLGNLVGLALFNIGPVNLAEGTVVSWVSLFAIHAWRR